jgi:hypothetical protein
MKRFRVAASDVLRWRNQPFWHGALARITHLIQKSRNAVGIWYMPLASHALSFPIAQVKDLL